jgi:hypothetical protein
MAPNIDAYSIPFNLVVAVEPDARPERLERPPHEIQSSKYHAVAPDIISAVPEPQMSSHRTQSSPQNQSSTAHDYRGMPAS